MCIVAHPLRRYKGQLRLPLGIVLAIVTVHEFPAWKVSTNPGAVVTSEFAASVGAGWSTRVTLWSGTDGKNTVLYLE